MASFTKILKTRRRLKLKRAGRKRKKTLAKRSTLTMRELFAACGEPGKPVQPNRAAASAPPVSGIGS